jgi:hypothetical protein
MPDNFIYLQTFLSPFIVMKRRDFVLSAIAGIGVVSISTYYFLSDVEYDAILAHPHSLSLIWDTQTINSIGNQYRTNTPDESSASSLVKLLQPGISNLDEVIEHDFETGKTVIVDGWVLSITEARQCALASTAQS